MTSLSNRYERLKEIPGEFGSNPSLPLPEQVHYLPSSQNRKAIELGPKFHIAGLECIHKVQIESLLGYMVMAGNVKTPENQRFCVLMKKMID
ncbi:hypothetical protein Tco_1202935 [Tanacetum coccineum]